MKQYKKIDIFTKGEKANNLKGMWWYVYKASTTQFKTCRDSKAFAIRKFKLDASQVKCNFAKE